MGSAARAPVMIRPDAGLSELRILVVDDEDVNLLLLRRTLEKAGYRRVHTTTDPTRVPALFAEIEPALVVLDLHMPQMDGFELMDRLAPIAGRSDRGAVPGVDRRHHREDKAPGAGERCPRFPDQALQSDGAGAASA